MKVALVYNRPVVAGNEAALCSADVLSQVEAVRASLLALGHEPVLFALGREDATRLPALLKAEGVACAVNLCEALDDDNRLQGHVAVLLELAGVPYTGSEMLALTLTTDKYLAKKALAAEGIPTPRFALYRGGRPKIPGLRFPLILKPRYEDGSVGIEDDSVVEDGAGLASALTRLHSRHGDVLIEEYIEGRELYAALLGYPQPQPLPVSEIDFSALGKKRRRIVGYRAKWVEESPEYAGTTRLFPTDPATEAVQAVALRCFRLFGCRDYARVDIRLSPEGGPDGTPYVLEVNANPCLSPESGYAAALAQAGIAYQEFVRRLLGYARRRADQLRGGSTEGGSMTELRGLTPDDRPQLARLLERTAAFNAADRLVALELIDDALSRGEASDYRFICAVAENELAGYVCFGKIALTESSFDLYWIVVDPDLLGRGLGRGLLEAAEAACRQLGGTQLFAETSSLPDYGPARALYEAAGFELVSHIADFYAPGNDRLTYGKRLS